MLEENEFYKLYGNKIQKVHSFMECYKHGYDSVKETDFNNNREYKEFIMPLNFDVGFIKLSNYDEEYFTYLNKCHNINNYNLNMINNLIPHIIGNNGKNLKRITNISNCEFIWYNKDKQYFEIYAHSIEIINYVKILLLKHIEFIYHKKNK